MRPFLAEYIAKIPAKIVAEGNFHIHDDLDIEQAAIDKSEIVVESFYGWDYYLRNSCAHDIRFAIFYLPTVGSWLGTRYWNFGPGNQSYLADTNNQRLHSSSKLFFWKDESVHGSNLIWARDYYQTVDTDGRQLGFRTHQESTPQPSGFSISVTCSG